MLDTSEKQEFYSITMRTGKTTADIAVDFSWIIFCVLHGYSAKEQFSGVPI